ncbi:hypothetical protein GCM10011366_03100 [Ornithinimicrobium tianjinense]|uniref:SurA N-terminal domain-containing protein n=1 Tax=Ornithinimicrobium tianjinense TaxID=1195761 RepID=A0A917BGL3_9MICO|nr:hypothetical protein GCM10011366_03100 [Ornithinimicrobium tianjinense]
MMARVKRHPLKTALALTAVLALAGCSTGIGSDTAVSVDGTDYTVAELQEATTQLNALAQQPGEPQQVVADLALLPLLDEVFAGSPAETTESAVRQLLATNGVNDPGRATLDAARSRQYQQVLGDQATFQDPAMAEALQRAQSVTTEDLAAVEVDVNPRYGTWDATNGGLSPVVPDWIQADDAAADS